LFTNFLISLLTKLRFIKVVIARFLIILFRRRKGIELLHLQYDTEHLFDNSLMVINYRFKNALYYKFGNRKTLEKQIKIFNLKNFDNEFQLTVYGFFQKKAYKLKVEPQLTLNSESFKTSISNLSLKLEEQNNPILSNLSFRLIKKNTIINTSQIKLKTNSFNQNEFI
jgi:hypothetical protein